LNCDTSIHSYQPLNSITTQRRELGASSARDILEHPFPNISNILEHPMEEHPKQLQRPSPFSNSLEHRWKTDSIFRNFENILEHPMEEHLNHREYSRKHREST
jgi:hypothetical protein